MFSARRRSNSDQPDFSPSQSPPGEDLALESLEGINPPAPAAREATDDEPSALPQPPADDPPRPDDEPAKHASDTPPSSLAHDILARDMPPYPRHEASTARRTPFLLPDDQPSPVSYGSVSSSPARRVSPASSDAGAEHPPVRARDMDDTAERRSLSGLRNSIPALDSAVVMAGVDGRFAVPDAALATNTLGDAKSSVSHPSAAGDEEHGEGFEIGTHEADDELFADNSTHELVRASVSPVDNTTLPINTPRMWSLSVIFAALGSSTNLFFSLRYPSVAITPVIALLLAHPLGHGWDLVLKRQGDPIDEFVDGVRCGRRSDSTGAPGPRRPLSRLRRLRLWLAQGRWNEKEHTCVYVSSNIAFGFAFATDVIVEQHKFYGQDVSIPYQLLLTISSQMLGYTFAGITRRFLVRPASMVWPATLMSASMFSTLHKEENKPANGWRVSRWRFFLVVFLTGFLFYFLPGLVFPALSYFNVLTWFAPDNVVVSNLFGVVSGLGLFPLTFDWAQVTYIGSPLVVPFWASVNVISGIAIVIWVAAPVAYYANAYFSSYMPILSSSVFDNTGKVYDVSRILTPEFLFDREAYAGYSRVFLPITYVLSYGVQFAGLAALLTHTICWHGPSIWATWKNAIREAKEGDGDSKYQPLMGESDSVPASPTSPTSPTGPPRHASVTSENMLGKEDVHGRLMRRYKDAPLKWYLMTFVSMLAVGIFVVEYYPVHLPWYGLLLALAICALFFIPNGIIMAVTNQHSSIYLICQLVCGIVFPGRPVANMVFVTYGYISSAQGIKFASDLKLGHYMKVPPRILFSVQIVATLVSSCTQIGVLNWMFANVKGLCTEDALNGFTCPIARVHFNGSILWGVVGPTEFFGRHAIYRNLIWFFLVGGILPLTTWLYVRRRKHSIARMVNFPVMFGTMGWIPPATGLNFSVWALMCFAFNYVVKRRWSAWWGKYIMTLSAALDSGLAFGIVVVFFGFVYSGVTTGFSWWGTEVYKQGCDWKACAWKTVEDGETFGPDVW